VPHAPANPTEALLLTSLQAAKLLTVSPRTLWELTKNREIRVLRIGRLKRYRRSDLEAYIAGLR
jgi:excisionase family DNA binding protein